jgi:hypothetical protein
MRMHSLKCRGAAFCLTVGIVSAKILPIVRVKHPAQTRPEPEPKRSAPLGRATDMAHPEEELRNLATAIIEESGADAHEWTKRRAALFRKEGDYTRAGFWEDVAWLVLKIQRSAGRYH